MVGDVPALPESVLRGLHRVKVGRPRYPSVRAVIEIGMSKLEKDSFNTEPLDPALSTRTRRDSELGEADPGGPMVFSLVIRPMTEADIAACLVIEQATYPSPWTEGIFRDELAAPGRSYFVAEDERVPVGYGGLMVVLPDAHVTSVTVDPKNRGRQIGTRLMLKLAQSSPSIRGRRA